MYVLCSICANPPNAPTIFSISWNVACVLWLNDCVRLCGLFGSIGMPPMPPMPPYMPPMPIPPIPPIPPYMPPP